ncbi:MAG TPA: DNA-formamidopyrimidine glycosylase family protein [Thermoanaerobaculia bacterium]|jgi:formamidopyrimidine-DNA glycosylase|nr:DNA-formamidopyrimidine glycosylase family protein [Thermoanaerobaculia bacterium]
MPEFPDLEVYLEALRPRIGGQPLEGARISSPFLLRTVEPTLKSFLGRRVEDLRRLGKRLVIGFEGERFMVLHLMVTARLQWKASGAKVPGKIGLAAFDFPTGTLLLTEAGGKKRASLHLVVGEAALAGFDPGGLEVMAADLDAFQAALTAESHTLKRALTDPHILSGIGNSYSDEILHRAKLSPFRLARNLAPEEMRTLFEACREVLAEWTARLRAEAGDGFPEKVTAFHERMAVHGRFGKPCPVCGTPVQRIVYADNEANYCPTCQTGGKLLADRALSQLLRKDWPKTLEELEARKRRPSETS